MDATPQKTSTEKSLPEEQRCCRNTDRELWREREGDYYADSIHVTESGGIGINCGGTVIVNALRHWFELAKKEILSENPNAFLPHPVPENPLSVPPVSEDSSSPAERPICKHCDHHKQWHVGETLDRTSRTACTLCNCDKFEPSPAVEDIGEVGKGEEFS